MNHQLEDIEIKSNAIELLKLLLKKKRKKLWLAPVWWVIHICPIESRLSYVRKVLEWIEKYGFGFSVITKSKFILRNLDLLEKMSKKTKCIIQMILITFCDDLCRIIESNVTTTKERLKVLMRFREKNIEVFLGIVIILGVPMRMN